MTNNAGFHPHPGFVQAPKNATVKLTWKHDWSKPAVKYRILFEASPNKPDRTERVFDSSAWTGRK